MTRAYLTAAEPVATAATPAPKVPTIFSSRTKLTPACPVWLKSPRSRCGGSGGHARAPARAQPGCRAVGGIHTAVQWLRCANARAARAPQHHRQRTLPLRLRRLIHTPWASNPVSCLTPKRAHAPGSQVLIAEPGSSNQTPAAPTRSQTMPPTASALPDHKHPPLRTNLIKGFTLEEVYDADYSSIQIATPKEAAPVRAATGQWVLAEAHVM